VILAAIFPATIHFNASTSEFAPQKNFPNGIFHVNYGQVAQPDVEENSNFDFGGNFFCRFVRICTSAAKNFARQRSGHVSHLTPIGRLPSTNHLNLAIGLPLRNQAALDEFLRQLYDPGSTNYHKYLAPQEFAERFGPTEQDYQAVKNFAE